MDTFAITVNTGESVSYSQTFFGTELRHDETVTLTVVNAEAYLAHDLFAQITPAMSGQPVYKSGTVLALAGATVSRELRNLTDPSTETDFRLKISDAPLPVVLDGTVTIQLDSS